MSSLPTAVDTITLREDLKEATITNAVGIKYAHKLLQDYIKQRTGIKGYWTFYLDYTDSLSHHFIIDHPMLIQIKQGLVL